MRSLIAAMVFAVTSAGVSAQSANRATNGAADSAADAAAEARARLIAADADKDGKWSLAEWTAAGRREMGFAFCDTGKDGLVDATELKICAEKARAMGMTAN